MASQAVALIVASHQQGGAADLGAEDDHGRRRASRSATAAAETSAPEAEANVVVETRHDAGMVVRIRAWRTMKQRQEEEEDDDDDRTGLRTGPPRKVAISSRPASVRDSSLMELDPYQAALPLLDLMHSALGNDPGRSGSGGDADDDDSEERPISDLDDGVDYVCVIINGASWNRRGCNWSVVGDLVDEIDDELDDDPSPTEFWIVPRSSLTDKDLSQLGDINDYNLERIGACQSDRMRFIKNLFKRCQFRRVRDLYAARRKGHVSIARYISLIFFVRL